MSATVVVQPTFAFTTSGNVPASLSHCRRRCNHQNNIVVTTIRPQPRQRNYRTTPSSLQAWRLVGKYFQIEEMEDRDSCTTEVILNSNATISTLATNGPRHVSATGMWKLDPSTGDFIMTLHRTYEAGRDSKISTNVGMFTFTTVRKFIGRLYNIGIKQGISGNTYDVTGTTSSSGSDDGDGGDENNNSRRLAEIDDTTPVTELRKVGFFEMIDSTLNEDGEVTLRGRTRSM